MIKQVPVANKSASKQEHKIPVTSVEGDLSRIGSDKFRKIGLVHGVRLLLNERREKVYGRD